MKNNRSEKFMVFMVLVMIINIATIGLCKEFPKVEELYPPINASEEGSGIKNAIVIKNISNYEKCKTEDDVTKEYRKSIEQWLDYVNNRFGQRGVGWEYSSQSLVSGKNVEWVDRRKIILLPSKEEIILYFDITEPFKLFSKELEKYK